MVTTLNYAWESWEPTDVWGARVEYMPNSGILDELRGKQISYEDFENISQGIAARGKEAIVDVPSIGLVMDYFDWTTGIDFGHEHDGGGYDIGFSYGDEYPRICVLVKWADSYAEAAGLLEERSDEDTCIRIGLSVLNEFLATL